MGSSETTDVMLANPPDAGKLNRAQQATLSMLQQADALDVVDEASCRMGGKIITLCADMTRDIKSLLDPGIAAAFTFHRTLTGQRSEYLAPLGNARDVADRKMGDWRREQRAWEDRQAADVQKRLMADVKEKRDAEVDLLDKAGRTEEAVARIDAPLPPAPPVNIHSEIPKIAGQSVRVTWKASVVDPASVPRDWCIPDQKRLDAHARATRGAVPVRGVQFVPIETTAQRRA